MVILPWNKLLSLPPFVILQNEPYSVQISDSHTGPIITVLATDADTDWPFNLVTYTIAGNTGLFGIDSMGAIRGNNLGKQTHFFWAYVNKRKPVTK